MTKKCDFRQPSGKCFISDMTDVTVCDDIQLRKCPEFKKDENMKPEKNRPRPTVKFKDVLPLDEGDEFKPANGTASIIKNDGDYIFSTLNRDLVFFSDELMELDGALKPRQPAPQLNDCVNQALITVFGLDATPERISNFIDEIRNSNIILRFSD